MPYFICACIGVAVGASELVTRYRDEPIKAFGAIAAWAYVAVNAGAAIGALYLVKTFQLSMGMKEAGSRAAVQVMVSGISAMAIVRSSIVNPKLDGKVKIVGPAAILDSFLNSATRSIDKRQGVRLSRKVTPIMQNVSFEAARRPLVDICIELMPNMPTAEVQQLRKEVAELAQEDETSLHKTLRLGFKLYKAVGENILREAVESLGADIRTVSGEATGSSDLHAEARDGSPQ